MAEILATDIRPEIRNDSFFGKGFEDLMEKAEAEGKEVVVGHFLDKPRLSD